MSALAPSSRAGAVAALLRELHREAIRTESIEAFEDALRQRAVG